MIGFFSRRLQTLRNRFWGKLSSEHRKGLFGIGWTTIAYFMAILIRTGSSLILTRLLMPEAWGVVGPAMAYLVLVELLSDIGLRPALIRHPRGMEPAFLGTGWLIGLTRSILLSLVILGIGLTMPYVNNNDLLGAVLVVFAIKPIIHACSSPQLPQFYREMRYKEIAIIELTQTIVGVGANIVIAKFYPSVWSIVAGTLLGEITYVLMTYYYSSQIHRPQWNREASRELYQFGNQVFINTLVMGLWLYVDRLFGLNFVSEREMGLYIIAGNLAESVERLLNRFGDVYFSMLSRQNDDEARTRYHQIISKKLAYFGMPILGIGVLLAPVAIWIMYDPRYRGAGLLFALLMARLMMRTLANTQYQYLMVRAEIYLQTRCYLLALLAQAILFVPLSLHFGTIGMALSAIISTTALSFGQNLIYIRRGVLPVRVFVITLIWMLLAIILGYGIDEMIPEPVLFHMLTPIQ